MSFNTLPRELVLKIASNLDTTSQGRLTQTSAGINRTLYTMLKKTARKHAFTDEEMYANVIRFDSEGKDPIIDRNWLFQAPNEPIVKAIEHDHVDAVKGFLDAGVDANAYTILGRRLLYTAAKEGAYNVTGLLLEYGADPNIKNLCSENRPLIVAAAGGDDDNVQQLTEAGADVKARNVLHAICQACSLPMLQLALDHGANLGQPSLHGTPVLHSAVTNPQTNILQYLLEKYPQLTNTTNTSHQNALWPAIATQNLPAIHLLLASSIPLTTHDTHNETPLHATISHLPHTHIPNLLLTLGIRTNFAGLHARTELHYAAESGCQTGVVRALLARGLDPDARDNRGRTPLHCAARGGFLGIARVLVEEGGAVLDGRDGMGFSPMEVARARGWEKVGEYLENRVLETIMPS